MLSFSKLRRWWPQLLGMLGAVVGIVVSLFALRRRSHHGHGDQQEEQSQAAAAQTAAAQGRQARHADRVAELGRKRKIIERDLTRALETGPTDEAIAEAERDLAELRGRK